MEKKNYTKPIVEVIEFDVFESVMASGNVGDGPSGDTGFEEW